MCAGQSVFLYEARVLFDMLSMGMKNCIGNRKDSAEIVKE